jgi:glycosyltransferase involved in cell wall biosynthesis
VVLEAGAAGLPVVASEIPELREAGLALDEMSAEGVCRARDRSWEHLVTQWMDLYDQVLAVSR